MFDRRVRKYLFSAVLLVTGATVLWACAVNPVTGKREISLMSEGQEIQMGMQADQSIVGQYGLLDDPEIAAYVESIGKRMVPVSHRPDLEFHFRVLDDPVVNAFALPGGYVYITRGILTYLNSEGALAGVVGHEIGHVTARHGAQRYTQQALMGLGLGLGSVFSETFANYAGLAGQAGQLMLLKYGRDDERQSDELGVEYATRIGYDTTDMAMFFNTLDRLTPADGRLPSWMSTHPNPGERVGNVQQLTAAWQAQTSGPFEAGRDEFLRKIDGLIFGANPRHGFVSGGVFHHPDLRFRFPVPGGWALQNGQSQVVMVSPEQDAGVIFQAAQGASAAAAADAFVGQQGIVLLDRDPVSVAGTSGVRTLVRIPASDGSPDQIVVSTWFGFGDGVWVFHGITVEPSYTARSASLVVPADGFAAETDPAVLNKKPVVIKVIEATHDGRFVDIVSKYPIPADAEIQDVEGLAILNGADLNTPVFRGALLKVLAQ